MTEQPNSPPQGVSSDAVLDIIRKDTIGAYLLRAAIAEAMCDVYEKQLAELRSNGDK